MLEVSTGGLTNCTERSYRWSVSLSVRLGGFLIISSLLGGSPETPATFSSLRLRTPGLV